MVNVRSSRIISLLLLIYASYIVWNLAVDTESNLWDFKAYYYSVKALDQDLNPYDTKDLSVVAQKDWITPFVYPPLTLNFFKIFNLYNIDSAAIAYLLFKVLLLTLLVFLWKKILNIKNDNLFYLFILLAFNSAVYIDLRVGNVTIIIQLLLWTGIWFYLNKKYLLFCFFIVLASVFKLIPIIFLILILFTKDKKKYQYFIGSSLAFAFYLLLNYLIYPDLFAIFIQSTFTTFDAIGKGITHPALFSFVGDALTQLYIVKLRDLLGIDITAVIEWLIFILIISVIMIVTVRSYKKTNSESNITHIDKELILVSLFCIVFSFVIPRFKDYDFILLILPSFYIINKIGILNPKYLLVFIFVISSVKVTLPGVKEAYKLLWSYYPLFPAIISWVLYIVYLKKYSDHPVNSQMSDVERETQDFKC